MKLSVSVTNYSWPGPATAISDRLAELAGFLDGTAVDTLWVADHLMQADPSSSPDEPMLEAYTTLGYLAARTSHLRLGTMVTAATFRVPALLVKAVTTLDVLSKGRAWLGVGAGYNVDEARAMGLFMPATSERFAHLAELLQTARRMWDGGARPRPLTAPRPPVLIGGAGERRTLRLVAENADACNLFDIPDGGRTLRRKLEVLDRHCAEVGRRPEDVERTVSTALSPGESVEDFVGRCRDLCAIGLQHVVVIARGRPWNTEELHTLATAAKQLSAA